MNRILSALAALLLSASAAAATIAERSPFTQGHWWDPTRSGSGFDLFNIGDQAMVIWYTYEQSGRPVWYTAQGSTADLGTRAWPLLKHRWVNGAKGDATSVGSLKVTVRNSEAADVDWTLDGREGRSAIQPFLASGAVSEVDHTGSWFDPAHSGWGLSLTEQGDVVGGVLFTYDIAGTPTWAAGFGRDPGSAELFTFEGACPSCSYRSPVSRSAGRLAFNFSREWEMTLGGSLSLPMAGGIAIAGPRMVQLSRPASSRPADRQLASFDSAARLKAHIEAGMVNVGVVVNGADFSAAPPSVQAPYSTTNLQEQGVDEADLVKSDGRFIYTYRHDAAGAREPVVRVAEVTPDGGSIAMRGAVSLAAGATTPMKAAGLFLHGNNLVSVSGTQAVTQNGVPSWASTVSWAHGTTHVEVLDVSNPAQPQSRFRVAIDGHPVTSRRIGDRIYVISRFVPYLAGYSYGGGTAQQAANRQLLAATPLDALLPKMSIGGGDPIPAVQVSAVHAPPLGSNRAVADMILVTVIDAVNARLVDTMGVLSSVEAVYASTGSLYFATTRQELRTTLGAVTAAARLTNILTDIHQVRLGGSALSVVGSATVEGFLATDLDKAPFRMSEHQGRLRVVTSNFLPGGFGIVANRNRLSILEPSVLNPGVLRTVSMLPNATRPEPLGKPLEELYATRFVGDRLYAVTFTSALLANQVPFVDPLYVVDLANPADPKIRGELVIPGFSDYLHPLDNGLLLGFGRSVTSAGIVQGLQLSLFDVSNDGAPRVINQVTLGKRGSDSALFQHHHAFSILPAADGSIDVAFPARIHDGAPTGLGTSDAAMYPWLYSGLKRFQVRANASGAAMQERPELVTHRAGGAIPGNFPDAAASGARSVLFPNTVIYVANGLFWRQDASGSSFGPF